MTKRWLVRVIWNLAIAAALVTGGVMIHDLGDNDATLYQRQSRAEHLLDGLQSALIEYSERAAADDRADGAAVDVCLDQVELLRYVVRAKHARELPSLPRPWPVRVRGGDGVPVVRRVGGSR